MFMAEAATQKKPRPKNLDLTTIRLPLPGFVSILHRISGAGLFLMLPVLLWLFQASVATPESYETFRAVTSNFLFKILLLGLIWAYMHHFCAGIRFLLLDLHVGLELQAARSSAKAVLAVSIPAALLIWGVVVW
jgi:succinate dehydrogenase / fumarate reductase cytochrome b subunit